MTNKEVLATIKDVNEMVDQLAGLSTNSKEYADIMECLGLALDCITIDCPRWKYHRAWELHVSKRTGHYWVTFTQ